MLASCITRIYWTLIFLSQASTNIFSVRHPPSNHYLYVPSNWVDAQLVHHIKIGHIYLGQRGSGYSDKWLGCQMGKTIVWEFWDTREPHTLCNRCHGIFNDHRDSGPWFNISSKGRHLLQHSVPRTALVHWDFFRTRRKCPWLMYQHHFLQQCFPHMV